MSNYQQVTSHSAFTTSPIAVAASEWERTLFIRRTYAHLAIAVLLFIIIEMVVFQVVPAARLAALTRWMLGGWHWAIALGAFMVVSMIADRWARSTASLRMQYGGLILYVVAEAVILIPLLLVAQRVGGNRDTNLIAMAGFMTACVFAGLTLVVFVTRADVWWLGRYLAVGTIAALAFLVGSWLFGFNVGQLFCGLMVALAGGYIVYYTSNVLHHYRLDQHVAASLALFSAVALLFWYILQLVLTRD